MKILFQRKAKEQEGHTETGNERAKEKHSTEMNRQKRNIRYIPAKNGGDV